MLYTNIFRFMWKENRRVTGGMEGTSRNNKGAQNNKVKNKENVNMVKVGDGLEGNHQVHQLQYTVITC